MMLKGLCAGMTDTIDAGRTFINANTRTWGNAAAGDSVKSGSFA